MKGRGLRVMLAAAMAAGLGVLPSARVAGVENGGPVYHSPFDLAFSPDGRTLAVSDRTAGSVVMIRVSSGEVARTVKLHGEPTGVVWSADGRFVYVAECTAGTVAEVDAAGKVKRRLKVGPWPVGLAIAQRRGWLLAANSATDTVSVVSLADGREKARVDVVRSPYFLAVTPDETMAVVGNRLPSGDASDPAITAAVTLIDLESPRKAADIPLPPNSVNVHGVAVSPDRHWAYVVHNVGRTVLPTEQIEYGWINANAMSIIDLTKRKLYATILVDRPEGGAANPWGVDISADGKTLWITLSGVHRFGRLDLRKLHELLDRLMPSITDHNENLQKGGANVVGYADGHNDRTVIEVALGDLPAQYTDGLYLRGLFFRSSLPGNGPRGVAISPDGKILAVAMYYSGNVLLIEPRSGKVTKAVSLGDQPEADPARRGEIIFHDANYCFQRWLSCATCHPDGRADGLNWDLLNDGIGNPKNTRSLLLSHRTPPAMWRGVRPNMEAGVEAGFKFILFNRGEPEDHRAVEAYLRAMKPTQSPYLIGGRLSEEAGKGKAIFERSDTRCADCHPAPLYTDLKMHNVETRGESDRSGRLDTPSLVEVWRTAPYLHDGRAATLRDVVTKQNKNDRHGRTSHLSAKEIDALLEYLRSL